MTAQARLQEMSEVRDEVPPSAWSEAERLAALAEYGILDTAPEIEFDDIVELATRLFDVPVALVSLVTDDRQWFKAEIGLGLRETSLEVSICKDAIRHPGVFVVPDLLADPCYASNPLVACENGLRFFAGAKLQTKDGLPLGSVSILDRKPRPEGIGPDGAAALEALARQVMSHLELRKVIVARDRALLAERASAQRYTLLANATRDAIWDWDIDADVVIWNEALHDAHGYRLVDVEPSLSWWESRIHPEDRARVTASIRAAMRGHELRWSSEYRFRQAGGGYADILDRGSLIRDGFGKARRMVGAMLDLTERNRATARRAAMAELGDRLRELDDPSAMAFAAAETMGRTLRVERAGYAGIDVERETVLVERDWTAEGWLGGPDPLGFRHFGGLVGHLRKGETVAVADVECSPLTAPLLESWRAAGIRALVNLPVIDRGQLVAVFYLHLSEPRSWTDGDLAFVRNVADAMRAAAERARSMAALRASEELFRVFAQAMPNQVWAADAGGRVDWLNHQVDEYFGQAVQEDTSRTDLIHPNDREDVLERWRYSVATGQVFENEFRLRHRDGTYRWFLSRALPIRDEQGTIRRWIGTNTDVDEQKSIAAELAQANHLLASRIEERTRERDRLWSTTSDLMGTAGPNGFLTSVNPAWTRMLGWSEPELLATPPIELLAPEDRAEAEDVAARLAAGKSVESYVNRLRAKDGSVRTVMWNVVPDRGAVYFVGRDISDQREVEEQLRQAQKMEAVGQLTGGIAHDFNNLLTGIIGSLDLLQTRLRQGRSDNLERYVRVATNSANRAAALTHRLLAFARRQPLDPRPVDVAVLVNSLEDLLRRTIGEAIGLSIETDPNLWPTLCDANQLESAILNLAINARDAMPDGGQLRIVASNTFLDSHAALHHPGEMQTGQYVCIGVIDTGAGMTPEVIERAFDPFFTTKPLGQGTGLGLSMVYGFARQSEGLARIVSEPGRGTTINLYLPRHDSQAVAAEIQPSAPVAVGPRREETVLVVEDEMMVRDLVVEILGEMGLHVIQAVDGASGLKVLESDRRIDLLVSDVGLPGMNGRQMADAARVKRPGLRVLFITGYAQNAALSGFLAPGMELVTKPFTVEGFATRVRGMLEG